MAPSFILWGEWGKTGRATPVSVLGRPENDLRWKSLLADQVRQNGRLFFRTAYKILRNETDAEDVVQQSFLHASGAGGELRDRVALGSWLVRTVTNESLQLRRRRSTERRVLEKQGGAAPGTSDGRQNVPDELRERVLEALEQLPDAARLVFVLRVIDGESGNQVKELLGCSAVEVSRHLGTARESLRRLLADLRVDQGEMERESNVL